MPRLWRFILALSITPLMTAACLAILGWMTWRVGSIERDRTHGWHVGKLLGGGVQAPAFNWMTESQFNAGSAQSSKRVIGIVESGSIALIVNEETALKYPGQSAVILLSDKPWAHFGIFGITRVERSVEVRVFDQVKRVWYPDEVMASLAAKCAKVPDLQRYVPAVRTGRGNVTDTQWSGYAYNTLAILLAVAFFRSLQWVWRGARMPWGSNRAWKIAANQPNWSWWFWRGAILSPWATFLLAISLTAMVSVNWKPIWSWQYELRRYLCYATSSVNLSQFDATTVPPSQRQFRLSSRTTEVNVLWLNDTEKNEWDKRGVWIPEPQVLKRGVFAPMTTADTPAVILLNTRSGNTDHADTRTLVETTMISRGVITPEQAPLLWTAQPKRIVWQGVIFNGTMLLVACAFLVSLLWLRDGVVWPWNARRLRQNACMKCGYSLLGLTTQICPECGKPTST